MNDELVTSEEIKILKKLFDQKIETDEDYQTLAEIFAEEE